MLAAFLAATCFAFNASSAVHAVRAFGSLRTNWARLFLAAIALGIFAHVWGRGFSSTSVHWFFLSGIIGMGLGDLAVYSALPLLGSRLTLLMTQCLAAPIAALGEWLWLGTRLSAVQITWGAVILGGIALAIMPSKADPPKVRVRPIGFLFGFLAACGQGFGALVSRRGVTAALEAGEQVAHATFGLTAAYHRILAGLAFTTTWLLVMFLLRRVAAAPVLTKSERRAGQRWLLATALAGPVLGVGCYQWALATTPGGVVLPIVATAPLLSIPLAHWLEGDRPTRRSILGGLVAVGGCIALTLSR